MNSSIPFRLRCRNFYAIALLSFVYHTPAAAQVSPSEVLNPDLKTLEQTYLPQLIAINQSVAETKFPYPLYLSRYIGLDPAKQAEADSRGLEFVHFQERNILKISANYSVAYNTLKITQNERGAATFRAVVLPVLKLVTAALPEDLRCDGIGFEISHHTRTNDHSYDYEGKEALVVVLGRGDAWAMSLAKDDPERQEILNRNQVFINGADFGLSLIERDPLNVQTLPRSTPSKLDATSTARSAALASRSSLLGAAPGSNIGSRPTQAVIESPVAKITETISSSVSATAPDPPPTPSDADRMDQKFQSQLAALAKEGQTRFHFVAYAPPTFVVFQDKLTLQMTLRNTLQFDGAKGSIYKRAAQSFDLFLAPLLKDLSARVSPDVQFLLFDFSVVNKISLGAKESSEAVEFVCPRAILKQFINMKITNQQLLDQSIILVNGVRIALTLQLAE